MVVELAHPRHGPVAHARARPIKVDGGMDLASCRRLRPRASTPTRCCANSLKYPTARHRRACGRDGRRSRDDRRAVLGGGHGAYATAADLALAGHPSGCGGATGASWRPARRGRHHARRAKGDRRGGRSSSHDGDLGEAVGGRRRHRRSRSPRRAHEDLARVAWRRSDDRQDRAAHPRHARRYVMAREIAPARAAGCRSPSPRPGRCRTWRARSGPAEVIGARAGGEPAGRRVSRLADRGRARARRASCFPAVRPCADVLDAALTNAGAGHPPAAGATQRRRHRPGRASTSTPPAPRRACAA